MVGLSGPLMNISYDLNVHNKDSQNLFVLFIPCRDFYFVKYVCTIFKFWTCFGLLHFYG